MPMRTALWLYLFLFFAFFDIHAQYPILTPFAVSLGAGPALIGWMMGMYSLTHLPGNLLAGVLIDRRGGRRYIVASLIAAGLILLVQAHASLPWHLLLLRAASGFALAFLSPACMTLLASLSSDREKQGRYMSGHGIVHTLASVVSPAAGAYIVSRAGFSGTFQSLGWLMAATGVLAYFSIPARRVPQPLAHSEAGDASSGAAAAGNGPESAAAILPPDPEEREGRLPVPLRVLLLPFLISCSQGMLFFELPLSQMGAGDGMVSTGVLLSLMSAGALVTLSLLFLNRFSPAPRMASALLGLAACFFALAAVPALPAGAVLFLLGCAKGILFPALATFFISLGTEGRMGRIFSLQSIAMSLGSFAGPVAAGQLRAYVSPYFLAFLLVMTALMLLPRAAACGRDFFLAGPDGRPA